MESCSRLLVLTGALTGSSIAGAVVSSAGWCSSCLPVTELLNSRIPLPSERPISGSFFGPKTSKTTSSRISSSGTPIQPGMAASLARRFGGREKRAALGGGQRLLDLGRLPAAVLVARAFQLQAAAGDDLAV